MTINEKKLYHQIHPFKLLTDWATTFIALYFFWYHNFITGIAIAFIPSIVVSAYFIKFAKLEKLKNSKFGKYIKKYMSGEVEMIRFFGFGLMVVGAWVHQLVLIPLGIVVILLAWLNGKLKIF